MEKSDEFLAAMTVYFQTLLPIIGTSLITMLAMDLRESDSSQIILPALALLAALIAWYNYRMTLHVYRVGQRDGFEEAMTFTRRCRAAQHPDPDAPTK